MTLTAFYWIGFLVAFCVALYDTIKTGIITTKCLLGCFNIALLSWIGIIVFIAAKVDESGDKVIWKRKE